MTEYTDRDIHRMVTEAGNELIQFPHAINEDHNYQLNVLVRRLAWLDDFIIKKRAEAEIDISCDTEAVRLRANYLTWLNAWRGGL